jgi:hypothetical protein
MLASGSPLVRAWLSLPSRPRRWTEAVDRIHGALSGNVIGIFGIVAINATCTSTFLGLVGVPWFLPLGLFSGLASLVPYVGALAAGVLLAGVAWASSGLWPAVATIGYYLVYQQLENHLIAPVVYRRAVSVNPLVILVSALLLGEVFGIAGAVLAVPIAATAQIVARELLAARRERRRRARGRDRARRTGGGAAARGSCAGRVAGATGVGGGARGWASAGSAGLLSGRVGRPAAWLTLGSRSRPPTACCCSVDRAPRPTAGRGPGSPRGRSRAARRRARPGRSPRRRIV